MAENKKPSQVLAHLEGYGDALLRESSSPDNHFTMCGAYGQGNGRVWPLLGVGADNAVPRSALADLLQMTERDVRRLVNRERRAGLPVCSSVEHMGYYKPATLGDIEMVERSMRRRARETIAVADALRRSLDEMAGQERIEEVLDGG